MGLLKEQVNHIAKQHIYQMVYFIIVIGTKKQ